MRITFVNLPAILLALAIGAVALPTIIDREDGPVPSIIDRDNSNKNSNDGGGPSHFPSSFSLCLPFLLNLSIDAAEEGSFPL